MQNMLFGDKPNFEEIMEGIARLEIEINLTPDGGNQNGNQ